MTGTMAAALPRPAAGGQRMYLVNGWLLSVDRPGSGSASMIFDTASGERAAFEAPFDVCVVGAGPAGITLARRLAGQGRPGRR